MRINRRLFIAAVCGAMLGAPDTPKNRVANAGNLLTDQIRRWADAFNRARPNTLDLQECEAFEPVPKLERNLEHVRREWIRGL